MKLAFGIAGLVTYGWGGLLLYYAALDRIPPRLQFFVNFWVRTDNSDFEVLNVALWVLFSLLSGTFLTLIGSSGFINV